MKRILITLLSLLLALPNEIRAQAELEVLDMRHGLPESRVRALCQMPDGPMAIATAGTVTIYDGTRFTVYDLHPKNEYPLPDYHGFRQLNCDTTGRVWLRNNGSLYVIDTRRERVVENVDSLLKALQLTAQIVNNWPTTPDCQESSEYKKYKDIVGDEISAITHDSFGGLWIGTKDSGIAYYNPKRKRQFTCTDEDFTHERIPAFSTSRASQLSSKYAPSATNCTLEGRTLNYAFLGTRNGVMIIDREDRLVATLDERDGLCTNNVVALLNDLHGDVWAATANGLTRIRQTGRDSFDIVNYGLLDGIDTRGREFRTGAICHDAEGRFTVGFVGGTVTFHPDSVTAPRYTFHFPRRNKEPIAPAPSSGTSWHWAVLAVVSAAILTFAAIFRRRKNARKVAEPLPPQSAPIPQTESNAGEAVAQDIANQTAEKHISSSELEFLDRLKSTIEQHIGEEDFSVKSLSEMMAMDRTVLYRRMQLLTGVSPSVYIKGIRMGIACRLLRETDLPIGDIAMKTGFATTKYFSAAFKDAYGMTPNEYRAQKTM